ncbi:helix-turn-helix domain-containing protein [Pseudofrankia inefficax]|uniref:Helix-turn-helix-domain containing protein AraC type n=1 Tax=Pseudofrankia inefficax (strain DSM 45817 / CECT 9037 / DDB 130130 / EuI1c) TaxID=298654 RepID=E3J954_PSEI1|nr:helix-turn-helix transcriptional regulator [Pseudofrankia inefficax]ADP80933.1 helix-turn-helix- domain containing protein AraC type [Pseudofrankia inefficax]
MVRVDRPLPLSGAAEPWIERVSVAAYASDLDPRPWIHVPDPATALVWRRAEDGHGALRVVGPRTRAAYHPSKDIPLCVQVRLTVGFAPTVLGIAARDLVDRVLPLHELWGRSAGQLADRLAEAGDDPARAAAVLVATLDSRARQAGPDGRARATLVRAAAVELSTSDGRAPLSVSAAARQVGVSERQLRNLFAATVGLPPKQLVRLNRIRAVLDRLGGQPQARLASDTGYYDQSHLAADFRQIMRVTPGQFAAGKLPVVPC